MRIPDISPRVVFLIAIIANITAGIVQAAVAVWNATHHRGWDLNAALACFQTLVIYGLTVTHTLATRRIQLTETIYERSTAELEMLTTMRDKMRAPDESQILVSVDGEVRH